MENQPLESLSYEQAFRELEDIVSVLEAGDKPLEEALALFARGQALAQFCSGLLDRAELKVQQISTEGLVEFKPNS